MTPAVGIFSAKDVPVDGSNSSLPNMGSTIKGYFQRISIGVVKSVVVDHEVVESVEQIQAFGVLQPFSARELHLKPEGERSWKWNMLHALPNIPLVEGTYIYTRGVKFRVMSLKPYAEYGYVQFELVEDYVGAD